jgi:hypothetical protein
MFYSTSIVALLPNLYPYKKWLQNLLPKKTPEHLNT